MGDATDERRRGCSAAMRRSHWKNLRARRARREFHERAVAHDRSAGAGETAAYALGKIARHAAAIGKTATFTMYLARRYGMRTPPRLAAFAAFALGCLGTDAAAARPDSKRARR